MGIRQQLADEIAANLSKPIRVIPYASDLDALNDPVIMLERRVQRKAANAIGAWLVEFNVHVISPVISRETADDALDDALDITLLALDKISWCSWTEATRAVFVSTFPSFIITVVTVTERTDHAV
jgi:hypothetical protein